MNLPEEQHQIWAHLVERQLPLVKKHVCTIIHKGYEILGIPANRIPNLEELNRVITPLTGWRTIRTGVRYSDALPWYKAFAKKITLSRTI